MTSKESLYVFLSIMLLWLIVWYSENMEEKTAQFYSEPQTERKYAIFADVDIYMTKKQHKMHININIYHKCLVL